MGKGHCRCSGWRSQLRFQSVANTHCQHQRSPSCTPSPVESSDDGSVHWRLTTTMRQFLTKNCPNEISPNPWPTEAVSIIKRLLYTTGFTQAVVTSTRYHYTITCFAQLAFRFPLANFWCSFPVDMTSRARTLHTLLMLLNLYNILIE